MHAGCRCCHPRSGTATRMLGSEAEEEAGVRTTADHNNKEVTPSLTRLQQKFSRKIRKRRRGGKTNHYVNYKSLDICRKNRNPRVDERIVGRLVCLKSIAPNTKAKLSVQARR